MIRTVPVEDSKLRDRAVIWGSIAAIVGPFLIGLPVAIFGNQGSFSVASAIGFALALSPIFSIPTVLVAGLLAKRALRRGFAGPVTAGVSGGAIGASLGPGIALLTIGSLDDLEAMVGFAQFFGAAGALWGLAYWLGVWAFVPEAVERPKS